MPKSGLEAFDATLHKSMQWVDEVGASFSSDRGVAYTALRTVLHALRDRLPVAEAIDLGAQLPMLIRGLYYEGWRGGKPTKMSKEDFLDAVRVPFATSMSNPHAEVVARSVLQVLAHHVSPGEIGDVMSVLPKELRPLLRP